MAGETWKENLLAGARLNPVSGASRCPLQPPLTLRVIPLLRNLLDQTRCKYYCRNAFQKQDRQRHWC